MRVLDAFRPRGATWPGQVISSPRGPSGGPSKTHPPPGGGVPRVHRARSPVLPRLPRFTTPRSVHQFTAVAAGAYPLRHPPITWSPGAPVPPGLCYWLVASGTPLGWTGGCLAWELGRGAVRHYCLGGCSAPSVCARRSGPVRGGSGRFLVLCLSRFPLPAPRVPRCVWRAVPSGCPLPLLAGAPFHAVCAFRVLGPVALLVVPACPLRVCALALPRRPLPPPLGGVACAPRAVPALGAGRAVPRGPCRSACPAPVPCSVRRAWGGAVRSLFPPTWLGVVGVAEGRPRGGCLPLLRGASGVRRSPSPDCPPTGRAVRVRYPRAVGAGVRVWGPFSVPLVCPPCGGCVPRGGSVAFVCWGAGWGGGRAPCPPFVRPGGTCRADGRSASFRPSALPGQATRRVSLALFCPWGAWPPIPLRLVLARLHWARSVRRPGALARARMFSAVPAGAGGWGGGARRAAAPLSGGGRGDHPPCLGGWGPGPPRLAGCLGGWGGRGSRRGLPAPPLDGGPRYPILALVVPSAHSPPACACGWRRGAAQGRGGMRGGPRTAPSGASADLNPPSALPEWAVVMGGSCGARPPYCSGAPPCAAPNLGPRVAPAGWCGLALRPRPPRERLGALGCAVCRSSRIPPPPRVAVPSRGGGAPPRLRGGRRVAPVVPKLGGGAGGGGVGGPPPRPPAPSGVGLPSVVSSVPPRGIRLPWGLPGGRGRRARPGRPPTGQCGGGGGGGEGGGTPPPWFAPPSSPGRPLTGPPSAGSGQGVRAPAWAVVPPHPGCSGLIEGDAGLPFLRSASVRSWA